MRSLTLSACLLLASFSCSKPSSGLSDAKKDELAKVMTALDGLPTDLRPQMAAQAIVEIEIDRLPKPLLAAFDAIVNADPAMKAMLISQGLGESMAAFNTMCKGKGKELMSALGNPRREKLGTIREMCETDRFELVATPKASTDPLSFLLAHVALSELQSKGAVTNDEKSLLRYFALSESPSMPAGPQGVSDAGTPVTGTDLGEIDGPTPGEENQAPRIGIVKIGKAETVGGLDKEVIQRYVRRKIPRIQFCYRQTLASNPKLTGTVNTSFVITPSGSVNQQAASGIGEEALEKCIAGALKTVKFPKPKGGGMVEAKFSFELSSTEAPATAIDKEQALAIVSGGKQLGNWINVELRDSEWHFAAKWKSGAQSYYIVDANTKAIVYSNLDSRSKPVPENLLQAKVKDSFHIVDHGTTPTVWVRD